VDDLVEELDYFFRRCLDQGHVLYLFRKFINQHEYELEVTWCWFERSNHIQAPACKGPGGWYGLDLMGWHVNSFEEKLIIDAVSNKLLCISYCRWLVKTCTECFTDQCLTCDMITTGSRMYFFQEFNIIFLLNALHQYFCFRIFAPQLTLDHQVLFAAVYKAFILILIRVPGAIY
jgi:hypothetical protein